jgi:nucleotide-binding universal stress UspA family protein
MKKVLIALDYDQSAQKVAEEGYKLAKAMVAEVVLLHVMTEPAYYASTAYSPVMGFGGFGDMDFLQPDIIEELKKVSINFLEKSKHHLGDDTIQTLIKEGNVADTINEAAKELHADIVVIGSHSRKWLESIVMGSVTEKVLHHTLVPLFIIPTKKQD